MTFTVRWSSVRTFSALPRVARRQGAPSCRTRGTSLTKRQMRPMNRKHPSTPLSDQSSSLCGGAVKSMKSRTVSAPYFSMMASGSTTFPLDLLILAPSLMTMPWVRSRVKGSRDCEQAHVVQHHGEEARVEQVEHRVLDAADVLVHRHPVVRPRPGRRSPSSPGDVNFA